MKKKLFTVMAAMALLLTMNVSVMAETSQELQHQKDEVVSQIKQLNAQNTEKQKQVDEAEKSIQEMDVKIEKLMDKINQNEKDIEQTKLNIGDMEKQVTAAEISLKEQQQLLDERVRAMYKNSSDGYIGVLLEAKGFSDLVARVEAVNKMVAFDKNVIKDMDEKKADLQNKKKSMEDQKVKIEKIKTDNEVEKSNLDKTKAEQEQIIQKTKLEMDDFQKTINDLTVKSNKLDIDLKEAQDKEAAQAGGILSRGAGNFSDSDVVHYAMTFLGTPYHFGGTSPETGFDCSGFVRYVYANFGVYLTRSTDTQIHEGAAVSRDNIQPGDLIFFGTKGDPRHVGMYIGNDCYIHSPQTGDVVKVSPLSRTDIIAIRRVR